MVLAAFVLASLSFSTRASAERRAWRSVGNPSRSSRHRGHARRGQRRREQTHNFIGYDGIHPGGAARRMRRSQRIPSGQIATKR